MFRRDLFSQIHGFKVFFFSFTFLFIPIKRISLANSSSIPHRYHAAGEMGPRGGVSEGVNSSARARGSISILRKFHKFSYSSSNFSIATAALSFIHISAVARSNVISTCVSHHRQRLCQTAAAPFVIVLSFLGLILKLTSDVLDCSINFSSSVGPVSLKNVQNLL